MAGSHVPDEALAPHRRRLTAPVRGELHQVGAPGVQRTQYLTAGVELLLHPRHPHRREVRIEPERRGQFAAGQMAGSLEPPQPEQVAVFGIEPVRGARRLPALIGQVELQQRVADELTAGVRLVERLESVRDREGFGASRPQIIADLVDCDCGQPGAQPLRVAERTEASHDVEHDFLNHVVDVGTRPQRTAHYRVDQRQAFGHQRVQRVRVSRKRGLGQPRVH